MPFAIPTLRDLTERVRQAFRAELPGSDAWAWPNNIYVTAKVLAGSIYELFGYADYIARQKFALTADGVSLDEHGLEFGLTRNPAAAAEGGVSVAGTIGAAISSGTRFQRTDGALFRAIADARIGAGGTATVLVRADLVGPEGNTVPNAPITVIDTVPGVGNEASVSRDGIGGGVSAESDERFRDRILFRKRNPPMGGAASDYVIWARQIPGITRVFVEKLAFGLGTVGVFVMMDDAYETGIPELADVARVQGLLNALAPASAIVCVQRPYPLVVDVTVRGLSPDTQSVRDAAIAELRDAFRRLAEPGRKSADFRFSRSWIWNAVASATGEDRHEIVAPAADVMAPLGALPVLGTVRFV